MSQNEEWERHQYYNSFGSRSDFPPQAPPEENYTVFSDGYGNFLRVYPNQKYEMFTPQVPQQQSQFQPRELNPFEGLGEPRYGAPQASPSHRDSQGNFFINQLVGNWTPGTSILGSERMSSSILSPPPTQHIQTPECTDPRSIPSPPQEKLPPPGVTKKPRAVAEVKPMRMSYSDVLSKNVPQSTTRSVSNNATSNNGFQGAAPASQPATVSSKKEKKSGEKKFGSVENGTGGAEKFRKREEKKKLEALQSQGVPKIEPVKDKKKQKEGVKKEKVSEKVKTKPASGSTGFSKLGDDFEMEEDEIDDPEPIFENVYNVRKSENYDKAKVAKKKTVQSSAVKPSKQEKQPYKRQKGRKSQRMEIFEKIWSVWLEYIMKFFTWLWSLVNDVVWLSYGIAVDRASAAWQYVLSLYGTLRTEFGNNTNRPSVWIRNMWTRFDARFEKTSKWAVWRRSWRKKTLPDSNAEPKDYYKDGRLPSTADEAMYSLLNCKGKDAYSILGVTPECSQELIRKHYKKIAVLVHPDKNKQPGAEEAFKVLQRSFELIGEAENRVQYDQSMAEALNAEKAWSELNDLLKQLQQKISEAANTIRCSSCCSRHPRKPTGRPPYAARECNSCRIRHSAREGDIWAETTLFGLKWKYLALMEGSVYDITEWANCQKSALSHLQPNSHVVQYRIVLGQNNANGAGSGGMDKRKDVGSSEPTMDDILSDIYSGQNQQPGGSSRRRKNNK